MSKDQFYYDATGYNTLESLADLAEKSLNGSVEMGSDEWMAALRGMPVDSLAEFQSIEVAQLKLEEILRKRMGDNSRIDELRAIGDQAIVNLHDVNKPGAGEY